MTAAPIRIPRGSRPPGLQPRRAPFVDRDLAQLLQLPRAAPRGRRRTDPRTSRRAEAQRLGSSLAAPPACPRLSHPAPPLAAWTRTARCRPTRAPTERVALAGPFQPSRPWFGRAPGGSRDCTCRSVCVVWASAPHTASPSGRPRGLPTGGDQRGEHRRRRSAELHPGAVDLDLGRPKDLADQRSPVCQRRHWVDVARSWGSSPGTRPRAPGCL